MTNQKDNQPLYKWILGLLHMWEFSLIQTWSKAHGCEGHGHYGGTDYGSLLKVCVIKQPYKYF